MSGRSFSDRDIHLALDGELPEDERGAFRSWLESSPEMKVRSQRFAADRDTMRDALAGILDEPVPARLRGALTGEAASARQRRPRWWLGAVAALLLAAGGLGGYFVGAGGLGTGEGSEDRLAEQAIAAHVVYAAEKRHAVEVPASDLDHMQAWLSDRVGVRLVAPDLAADGFRLMGGRLLPADEGKAALLLYEDETGNRLSIFVTGDTAPSSKGAYGETAVGPRAVYWVDKGYGCAVVGSMPEDRLAAVAENAYRQLVEGISG